MLAAVIAVARVASPMQHVFKILKPLMVIIFSVVTGHSYG